MLPFDGSDEPYNYMQYMEYLENIGKYGKLNPPTKTFEQCTNDPQLLEKCGIAFLHMNPWEGFDAWRANRFIKQIEDRYGTEIYSDNFHPEDSYEYNESVFENMSDEEFYSILKDRNLMKKMLIELGRDELDDFFNNCIVNELGQIYCERVIDLPKLFDRFNDTIYKKKEVNVDGNAWLENDYNQPAEEQDLYQNFSSKYPNIGDCWTWCKGAGNSYNSMLTRGTMVNLKGWVNPEDVSWDSCIELENMDEYELRLYSGAVVQIDEIEVIEDESEEHKTSGKRLPLKGSLLVKA